MKKEPEGKKGGREWRTFKDKLLRRIFFEYTFLLLSDIAMKFLFSSSDWVIFKAKNGK